jgi:hypothetical protein
LETMPNDSGAVLPITRLLTWPKILISSQRFQWTALSAWSSG